jgi:hypothetical protein
MKSRTEQFNQHEHETPLKAGALILRYGKNVVNSISGLLRICYARDEPDERKFRFDVEVGNNYTLGFGLNRYETIRLLRKIVAWLKIDKEYIEFEELPGPAM